MTLKLNNKIALVTGGSSGIGRAIAYRFAKEGAQVILTGRNQTKLNDAVNEIGGSASTVVADVTKSEDLDRVYDHIRSRHGSLDILVANAGIIETASLEAASADHFDRTFDTNVKGLFFTVQKALPLLNTGSSVVLVSSVAHKVALPNYSVYAASKAAVRSLARTFAAELLPSGIRVNSLSPGPTNTPIFDRQAPSPDVAEAVKAAYAEHIPMKRLGRSAEIAAAALFLASSDSSFTTGADIVADGGLTEI